jgi:hypothetical protein
VEEEVTTQAQRPLSKGNRTTRNLNGQPKSAASGSLERMVRQFMSQSTPVCSLFCSRCKSQSARTNSRHYNRDFSRTWLDVEVVSATETFANCQCRRCGHKWKSRSMAAKRAMRYLSNAKVNDHADSGRGA